MDTKKNHYHHGDLRATLLEITARIIAEEGVEKVTMRALSQQAGVSRTAPYRHFPDKTALLCAIATDGFKKLYEQMNKVVEIHSGDDDLSCLADMAIAYVDFAVNNPSYYRLMYGREDLLNTPTPEFQTESQEAFNVLHEVIQRWQNNAGSTNSDPVSISNILWAAIHGLSMLIIDRQLQTRKNLIGAHPLLTDKSKTSDKETQELIALTVKTVIDGIKKM